MAALNSDTSPIDEAMSALTRSNNLCGQIRSLVSHLVGELPVEDDTQATTGRPMSGVLGDLSLMASVTDSSIQSAEYAIELLMKSLPQVHPVHTPPPNNHGARSMELR